MIDTSMLSYDKCRRDGLIGERQSQVLGFILDSQGAFPEGISRGDVAQFFQCTRSGYARRVQELEVAGILVCVGTKTDPRTDRPVKAYKPTGKIPTERVKSTVSKTVEIKTWWCQNDQEKYGPYFSEGEADAMGALCDMPETIMIVATATKATKS